MVINYLITIIKLTLRSGKLAQSGYSTVLQAHITKKVSTGKYAGIITQWGLMSHIGPPYKPQSRYVTQHTPTVYSRY